MVDRAHQKIFRRSEVRVEDGDEFAFCSLESFGKRSSLESLALGPVMVGNRVPQRRVAIHQHSSHVNGFVGRVIEQLDV